MENIMDKTIFKPFIMLGKISFKNIKWRYSEQLITESWSVQECLGMDSKKNKGA